MTHRFYTALENKEMVMAQLNKQNYDELPSAGGNSIIIIDTKYKTFWNTALALLPHTEATVKNTHNDIIHKLKEPLK